MNFKRIFILPLLICFGFLCSAQEKIHLYDAIEQNILVSLPIATAVSGDEIQINIGARAVELRDIDLEKISLWIFYEDMSLAEFETMEPEVGVDGKSALKKDILGREGFIGIRAPRLILQGKEGIKYEKITKDLQLKFKPENSSVEKTSVSIYFYVGKYNQDGKKKGKKDIRLFSALRPHIIEIQLPVKQVNDASQRMLLTAGTYTNSEKGDSAMFEGFKKNMTLYVERANNILEKVNLSKGSIENVTTFRKDLDVLKIDMDMEMRFIQNSSYASKMAMDNELMGNIKQFEKIYKEVYDVEQEVKEAAALSAGDKGTPQVVEKKKNPLSYFLMGGIGLMAVLSLFLWGLTKVMKALQKKRDAEVRKQLKKQQKKAKADQERILLEQSGTPRKKIKI